MLNRNRGWIVLFLFFCSGATALVYEVVWSKFLSQMFGSTIYAQTVVLAAFMGGLALGNKLFGRWVDRLKKPIGVYGYIEIAIALYAFFFPTLNQLADKLFISIGTGIAEREVLLVALKGSLAAALLLGPTILMGGTLPLLAAWLQKSSSDAGRSSARFYSVNSLGAVAGSAIAGFWLVQNLGMVLALQATAILNVMVGATAILLSDSCKVEESVVSQATDTDSSDPASPGTLRWAGAIVAATGFVSMGLEILASRSLALIFGSSLQSFALVLISFILGIGLGSAWIASSRRRSRASEGLIVVLLCAAAVWVTLLVFNIERWVDFYRIVRTGLGRTHTGYVFNQFLATGISLVVLGVPAALIGAVLPLMIRGVSREGAPLGAKVGSLLTWNTLGAVGGSLATGFFIMPLAGLRNAFGVLALVLATVALVTAWRHRIKNGMIGATICCALAGTLFVFGGEGWRHVMSSGVFRAHETEFNPLTLAVRKNHVSILLYEDAPDATVSVERGDGKVLPAITGLRINGKPDASTQGDLSTQMLLAHLPMMARGAAAKDVFILGFGSGISAGSLLPYPVENIVIAENCAPVLRAGRLFAQWNRNVLDEPRAHVRREDARTVLKLSPKLYDVIITEPSNPWTAGVGSVFSKEYYELAASRLKPGGVVAQWFHIYEMSDSIVALVMRTFSSVYPYVEVWDTCGGDIVLLGAMQPWPSGPEAFQHAFAIEGVRADLASVGIHSPEALMARQLASQRTGFAIGGPGQVQSDLYPILEYTAPEAFYIGARARLLERFDERTRQLALAPSEKRAILASLSSNDVHSVFSTYAPVNEELLAHLKSATSKELADSAFPAGVLAQKASAPSIATPLTAINAALEAGRFEEALREVNAGLKRDPGDSNLRYLARVLEREAKIELAAVASANTFRRIKQSQ
ncbi:MAG: fused MFS/spermidine synthase [Verrucomicrobia bacterium]|nr:fused MFS/spermidine synthase [Verrucomicrobiota bacterium]